jgi:hypothetical protein
VFIVLDSRLSLGHLVRNSPYFLLEDGFGQTNRITGTWEALRWAQGETWSRPEEQTTALVRRVERCAALVKGMSLCVEGLQKGGAVGRYIGSPRDPRQWWKSSGGISPGVGQRFLQGSWRLQYLHRTWGYQATALTGFHWLLGSSRECGAPPGVQRAGPLLHDRCRGLRQNPSHPTRNECLLQFILASKLGALAIEIPASSLHSEQCRLPPIHNCGDARLGTRKKNDKPGFSGADRDGGGHILIKGLCYTSLNSSSSPPQAQPPPLFAGIWPSPYNKAERIRDNQGPGGGPDPRLPQC